MVVAVGLIPGILLQQIDREAIMPAGHRPGAARILPFRLGWQAVTRALQKIGGDLHPLVVLLLLVGQVAPLVLGQALLLAEPVAVGRGMIPGHLIHGAFRIGTVPVSCCGMIDPGVRLDELLILLDGHLLGRDGKAVGDDPAMRAFRCQTDPAHSGVSPCGTRPGPR